MTTVESVSQQEVDELLKERAMDEAPVGITIADARAPDVPLIYVNDAFERITGYAREDVLGRNCRFLQGPETEPEPVDELRAAIEEERRTVVELRNYRRDGELFWNRVEVAPIVDESGTTTHFVGFQLDITDRRRAEAAVREEHAALSRLLERIDGLLAGITSEIVRATSVPDLHRRVPRRVVEADPYVAAWIGEVDLRTDAVVPDVDSVATSIDGVDPDDLFEPGGESAGAGESTDAGTSAAAGAPDATAEPISEGPVAEAVRTGEIRVSREAAPSALADRSVALAAVPLTYRESTPAVLVIYAADPTVFDEQERAVLASLGRAVATARNALESRRILTVEPEVELVVEIADPSLWLSTLAAAVGSTVEYLGSMQREDGREVMTLAIEGVDAEAVLATGLVTIEGEREGDADGEEDTGSDADGEGDEESDPDGEADADADVHVPHDAIGTASVVAERDDGVILDVEVGEESVVATLAATGARTRAIEATSTGVELTCLLAAEGDVRETMDALRSRYGSVTLRSKRERTAAEDLPRGFVGAVRDRLTDRQTTALHRAYVAGYFTRPRQVTGDDLAESMGITRSTFHQHLAAAQQKLLEAFFEDGVGAR
ncbi:MAG: bacterio-opsin activator domain-containing protein [Haloferacaceae archaeon]